MGERWKTGGRAALAVACGLAVLLAAPALASARSNGFGIQNQTGSTLRLQQISTSRVQPFDVVDGVARRPLLGLTLAPNSDPLDVELAFDQSEDAPISAELRFVDLQGIAFTVRLSIALDYRNKFKDYSSVAACSVTPSTSASRCTIDTTTQHDHPIVHLLDPPGTTRTVGGTDAQRQLSVLWDLCRDGASGHCSFRGDETKPDDADTFAPAKVVGQPILNCGGQTVKSKYAFDDVEHSTSSVGVELGITAKVEAIVADIEAGWTGSYSYKWGQSHDFGQTLNIPQILPRHIAYVELTVPIKRAYGTFTAQVNNTTWILEHVSFDTPDPGRDPSPAAIQNRPATSSELEACDKTSGTVKLRPSAVDRSRGLA